MLSLMEAMTGPVIRSWHFRLRNPSRGRREEVHKVQLRHFPLTGHRSVSVDGIDVQPLQDMPPQKGTGVFHVPVGSHDCCVGYRAGPRPGRYYYSCLVDGVVVPELNETVGDGSDDDDVPPRPSEVVVDSVGSARDSLGTAYMEFRVVTCRGRSSARTGGGAGGSGEACAVVWRRFSAFRQLHYDVASMLRGSHLLDSLPPLPAKCINPMVNQMGTTFIEGRRKSLQAYLRRLLEVPKARASVNLMGFLGLHPITGNALPWAILSPSEGRDETPRKDEERRA